MVPVARLVEIVMAGLIVVMVSVAYEFARMVIIVAGVVPGVVAVPSMVPTMPAATITVMVVRIAVINVVAGAREMKAETAGIRRAIE